MKLPKADRVKRKPVKIPTNDRTCGRIEKIVLSGKACLIRNLDHMIEHGSDIKTEVLNPFTTLDVKKDKLAHIDPMHGSVFTVPLGLTLRE